MRLDPNHPRPTLQRPGWRSLEGHWDFALSEAEAPGGVRFDRKILVPFPPEAPGSGVGEAWVGVAWYRKVLRAKPRPGRRLFLRRSLPALGVRHLPCGFSPADLRPHRS